jgi:uncharacterized membrane protein YkoI
MKGRLVLMLMLAAFVCVFASEKPVKMADLSPVIQKAIREQTKGAEILGVSMETENGKTFYEVETKATGRSRDLLLDTTGAVVEVEEEVTLSNLPPPAKAAIEKKSLGGKVTKVERVTKGNVITYEAVIVSRSGKTSEFSINSDGSPAK